MRALIAGCIGGLLFTSIACNPPNNGGTDNTVALVLGTDGVFADIQSAPVQNGLFLDIRADLPSGDRESATLSLDPADVAIDFGSNGPGGDTSVAISLLILIAPGSATDPCQTTPDFSLFNITMDSNGSVAVSPPNATVSDSNFPLVDSGTFGLCMAATADREVSLTLSQISLSFAPPGPVSAASCSDVLALPEVQDALALLDTNGLRFRVPTGTVDVDLAGRYVLDEATTFDPDGTDVGETQDGTVTLSAQNNGIITRVGFGGSADFFYKATPARSDSARSSARWRQAAIRPSPASRT
ncbi:MAG TPA: hypothetical protein P5572_00840 [Phycisphaerae bacterium]|mgnify:CR=1 FL=1|nr:hypothetical protein [Phycisphaerales bacterium]HRX83545.1 hypothetical protein [Phycisphaerae bacterium]